MNRKVLFVTGATDGIGRLTATDLAKQQRGSTLLIHGRNKEKLEKSMIEIKKESGNPNIEPWLADFSSLSEVRTMANGILAKHPSINVLINNAGAGFSAPRYGQNGIEMRLTVNYLAPVLLTRLLLPALKKNPDSRVINVASAGQSDIHFDDIMLEKKFDGVTAYTQSKLALIMFTIDLAEELRADHISVNCLHPGTYLDTGMVREAGISPQGSAQSGADAIVYLATSPDLKNVTGKYFNVQKEARAHAQAYDADARKKLRILTSKLTAHLVTGSLW
jgi:NAD(P)-dependent dehydrogenase (short-subunit alcohol dehydrogenase family)